MYDLIRKNHYKSHSLQNSYIKVYPDFIRLYKYDNFSLHRDPGLESSSPSSNSTSPNPTSTDYDANQRRSLRRTKTLISDLVLCNRFDSFATFTFAKDRNDIQLSRSKMSNWLKSQKKQYGHFDYIIVPEFHKNKKAIHFHALLKNYNGKISFSGVIKNGRKIYNIVSYRSGFTTLDKIQDYEKVSSYIKKYITKDMPQFQNKQRFWSSKNLKRPEILPSHILTQNPFLPQPTEANLQYQTDYFKMYKIDAKISSLKNFTHLKRSDIVDLSNKRSIRCPKQQQSPSNLQLNLN